MSGDPITRLSLFAGPADTPEVARNTGRVEERSNTITLRLPAYAVFDMDVPEDLDGYGFVATRDGGDHVHGEVDNWRTVMGTYHYEASPVEVGGVDF